MFETNEYLSSNAWVFQEAKKLKAKVEGLGKKEVIFETGYGPSGLPHIGTFAEVFRTTLVRQAFERISDIPTRLIAFSDDMDGLRKVPDNLPNQEMIAENLGKPLTNIPDPFGTHDSFGAHMNNRLKEFLDSYSFEYEFKSSTECYKNGEFNDALLSVLKNYDKVMAIILPTIGQERQETYSPFLPISPETGVVLQVPCEVVSETEIKFQAESGEYYTVPVTDGNTKLQWKPDWGMRWAALGVDYEMHGKDLTPSAALSAQICKAIGGKTPLNYIYEMFLDGEGQKISKSKGNGLSIEEWLKYGTKESLGNYLFANPRKARKLYFAEIAKSVDEYLTHVEKYDSLENDKKLQSPAFHIHNGNIPVERAQVSYSLLVNLASACNPEQPEVLYGFIEKYTGVEVNDSTKKLAEYALNYYNDFVKPHKQFKTPDSKEKSAILELKTSLQNIAEDADIQTEVFTVGKNNEYENLRDWFKLLYEVLLGQSQGPRMGSFISLFGKDNMIKLIEDKVA